MASNSTTPNEGVSGDEDNNSQNTIKKAATWKLLSEYNNKFDKDEDYIEFTKTIQQATGASDAVITSAILYRTSPYSNKPKATTTTQVTNTPRGPFQIAAAAAAAKRNNTTAESSLTRTATTNNNNNNNAVRSGENASTKRRRHVPGLQSSTDNRGGDQRSIRVQPRAANVPIPMTTAVLGVLLFLHFVPLIKQEMSQSVLQHHSLMKWGNVLIGQSAKRIVTTVVVITKSFVQHMELRMVQKHHHQRNNCNNK